MREWLQVDGTRTMNRAIDSFVHTTPAPTTWALCDLCYSLFPRTRNPQRHRPAVELNGGVWYPQGGIYQIAAALEKLARELGVEIVTGMGVRRILTRMGQVVGIALLG
ncbi:MAG: hypothetical protein R3E31_05560 [Chloroflexota bacterium]